MAENDDNEWLWFDEDEPVQTPLRVDDASPQMDKSAVSAAEIVKAVPLHLQGKSDEAIEELKRGLQKGLFLSELYSTLAQIYYEKQRYDEAAGAYAKLAEAEPKHRTANYNLAICLEKQGKSKEAADAFRKALDVDSKRADARLGLAVCLLRLKQPDLAIEQFDQYLSANSDSESAQFGKAICAHMLNRFDDAAAGYKKVLAKKANSADVLTNLVSLGLASKDFGMVREYADRLLK